MPARDLFHQAVRAALEKEGWVITHDPLLIPYGSINLYVDLGAERLLAAERESERIAVEIKSFLGSSLINEFHTALGQSLITVSFLNNRSRDGICFWQYHLKPIRSFFHKNFPS